MKKFKVLLSVILSLAITFVLIPTAISVSADTLSAKLTDMSDASLGSLDFVQQKLKIGYNIGNQFDGCKRGENYTIQTNFNSVEEHMDYWETLWTNAPITEQYVQTIHSYGIQLVRVPVTWYNHLDGNGVIDPNFLARVKRVVDMIIENDMYCMINVHHEGATSYSARPLIFDEEHKASSEAYLRNVWTQIGTYFQDYGTHLIFEAFNEVSDSSKSMTGNDARQEQTAYQDNVFIDTVRHLGGNNPQRFLVCPGYAGLSRVKIELLNDEVVGDKSKLIATKHYYTSGTSYDYYYDNLWLKNQKTLDDGMGMIVDEIGPSGHRPDYDNGALAGDIRTKMDACYGLSSCWWDNGQSPEYGLIDRATCVPTNYKSLAAYTGHAVTPATVNVNDINTIDTKQYTAKFRTQNVSANGREYVIIKSERPITGFTARGTNASNGYSINGVNDGWVSWYESDDDITYYRLDTRYINTFSYAKWKGSQAIIPGSNSLTYYVSGNYEIANNLALPCTVTIDGTPTQVSQGSNFTFPNVNNSHFVAYTDGTNLYKGGDKVTINEDVTFTSLYADAQMVSGASMRLNEKTGIRFYTSIDSDQITALRNLGASVELGTIIAHEKNLKGNPLTFNTDSTIDEKLAYVTVPFTSQNTYYTEGTFTGVVGSIVNVKDKNAAARFIGRGYITITKGTFTKTIYADYASDDVSNNTRSIGLIAQSIRQDTDLYASYSSAYKNVIDHYADLYLGVTDPSGDDKF